MKLTERIKAIRKRKGITQMDMSEKLGVGQSNYAYLEDRGEKLTIEQLENISKALEVTLVEILTGDALSVQNDERVKKLERRITELEDRIKDKTLIIEQQDTEHKKLKQDLYDWFYYDYFIQVAIEKGIGRIELFDVVTKETLISFGINDPEYCEHPIWKQAEKDSFAKVDYRYHLKENEKKRVAELLFVNPEIRNVVIPLILKDFIDDNIVKKAYHNWRTFQKRFE